MPIQPSALSAPPRILLSQSTSPRLVCGMRRASPPPLPGARERLDAGTTRREHPTTLRDVVPAESHDVRGPRAALGDVTLRRRRGRERFIAGEKSTRRSCRACRRAGSRRRRASWIAPRTGSHRGEDLDGRRPTESGGDDGPDLRGARSGRPRHLDLFFEHPASLERKRISAPRPLERRACPVALLEAPAHHIPSPTFPPHHRKLRTRRRSSARSAASPSATTPTLRRTTRAWKSFTRSKRRTASSPARSSRTSSSRRTRSGTRTIGDGRTGTKAPRTASRA